MAKGQGYKNTDFKNECFKERFEGGDLNGNNKVLELEKSLFERETV